MTSRCQSHVRAETISSGLLSKLLRETSGLLLALSEQVRRLERRVDEQRDDLELMIKAELMSRLGHFETQIYHRLERIEERVAGMERRLAE